MKTIPTTSSSKSTAQQETANPWFAVVERLGIRNERFHAALELTDGRIGARANRGRMLGEAKTAALIWGLGHDNPVVRRCCLEFLDQHPSAATVPSIVRCLDDPVPRVRWHAVHALVCDVCKPGVHYADDVVLERIRALASSDPSVKVRRQAQWGLDQLGDRQ